MNKLISSVLVLAFSIPAIQACDICGCAIGNGFSSVLPQFQKNFIGIRGSTARYESTHIDDGHVQKESSSMLELWGRYYIHKRLQVIASLPYQSKVIFAPSGNTRHSGIGDVSASLNYTVLNRNRDSFALKHLLLIGSGIKLPSGDYARSNGTEILNPAVQPGTGSVDYLFNIAYAARYKTIGLSNDFQYRLNGENSNAYAFGNKRSLSSRLFYWTRIGSFKVIPSAGVLSEHMDQDYSEGYRQHETGGYIYSATAACEIYYKRLLFSVNYASPFRQHLATGYIRAFSKLQVNTCLIF